MVRRLSPGILATTGVALAMGACGATGMDGPAGLPVGADASRSPGPNASYEAAPASAWPSFVRPTPNPSPTFLVHAVTAGETLTSIARLYGTTARSLAYWNRDRYPSLDPDSTTYEPDRIEVGWTLRLIPTEAVDEDELPEPIETPSPTPPPASPTATESATSSAASLP